MDHEPALRAAWLLKYIEDHPELEVHPAWVPHLKSILAEQDTAVVLVDSRLGSGAVKRIYSGA